MTPVILPKMGLTMEEAKLVRWFKKEGEPVKIGEALLEIETEKASAEIESPVNGFLKKVIALEGKHIKVESVLAYVVEKQEDLGVEFVIPFDAAASKPSQGESKMQAVGVRSDSDSSGAAVAHASLAKEVRAAPAARKLARDLGVHLAEVKGTGPSGRILPEDVRNFFEQRSNAEPDRSWEGRRSLRSLLTRSLQSIPHINIAREICADLLVDFKKQHESLTYTDIILKVLGQSLTEYPMFRTAIVDEKAFTVESVNIGLVVDTAEGIRIPVLKGVDQKSLQQISRENKELTKKARENVLGHDEMQDATVSITNLGMYGVDFFTAIIPYGQCAILTVSRIRGRRTAGIEVEQPSGFWLNLVVDHRLIDGATAARLLDRMARYLESARLFDLV
jgi:pyruvate dehydrogenase E2 component (dihydrolipoamide acetyltransferase)